ncbi:tyrosine--tRNA ligase [Candidatus Acidulodesulfobacterium sp. H_13]|uniref:tyrosine--tRNA ligase n=1 Tax=Candidatus Acidulodesulfobacterium sp. H_13 TaxID=3395470 RepID=UPI003AF67104
MDNIKHGIESAIKEQMDAIRRGSVEIIKEDELYKKLSYSLNNNIPLKIKAGFDPTSPVIHLGHAVLLNKLRVFQEYGHIVFFIIGDFTAMIGDPTGKSETRKSLSKENVLKNSIDYKRQAFKILKPEKTAILFNSWWLSNIKLDEFIMVSSNYTVRRMLEKDDFEKRYKDNRPIAIHEFIYPLLQGFDSLFLKSDIEIGGNDQKFNLIVGRELMKSFGLTPQVIMTMPLLEGLDGKNKMSKSLGNHIGMSDEPNEMFGKIMSISDEMMIKYYELLSLVSNKVLAELKRDINEGLNPITAKKMLALEIVERYWGKSSADKAQKYFVDKYQKKVNPEDINTIELNSKDYEKFITGSKWLLNDIPSLLVPTEVIISFLNSINAVSSNSEAKRLIKQGAVKIYFETKDKDIRESKVDINTYAIPKNINEFVLKVGKKKIYKIIKKKLDNDVA